MLFRSEPVTQALYVSMDRDAVNTVALPGELDAQTASAHERLAKAVDALHDSCAVPAQGAAAACQWCEMHGLCRRAHWP